MNGDCTEEELYLKFLNNFETNGITEEVKFNFIFTKLKKNIYNKIVTFQVGVQNDGKVIFQNKNRK